MKNENELLISELLTLSGIINNKIININNAKETPSNTHIIQGLNRVRSLCLRIAFEASESGNKLDAGTAKHVEIENDLSCERNIEPAVSLVRDEDIDDFFEYLDYFSKNYGLKTDGIFTVEPSGYFRLKVVSFDRSKLYRLKESACENGLLTFHKSFLDFVGKCKEVEK